MSSSAIFVVIWTLLGIGMVVYIWYRQEKHKKGVPQEDFVYMEKIYNFFLQHMSRVDVKDVMQLVDVSYEQANNFLGQLEAMGAIKRVPVDNGEDFYVYDTNYQSTIFRVYSN